MRKDQIRIISGGQTGADRAALDFALHHGISCGGYCPKGRKAEDGPIPDIYPLKELDSASYSDRTKRNIEASDGTLIFKAQSKLDRGSHLTLEYCKKIHKPWFIYHLSHNPDQSNYKLYNWIKDQGIITLNIAGNRESLAPGIYRSTYDALVSFYQGYLS